MAQLQVALATEEELLSTLATGGCKVLEVHSACGPCRSVVPTLKKLRLEGKDEEALGFYLIAAEACRQLEAAREHQGKSEPLFLVYRNGALKAKVHGADIPSLTQAVADWFTPLPGQDDVEENPFHLALTASASKDGSKRGDATKQTAGSKRK